MATRRMSSLSLVRVALAAIVVILGFGLATAAGASTNPDYTAPPPVSVQSNSLPRPIRKITSAAAAPARQRMPITGADVTQLAIVGVVLIGGGATVLAIRRRTLA